MAPLASERQKYIHNQIVDRVQKSRSGQKYRVAVWSIKEEIAKKDREEGLKVNLDDGFAHYCPEHPPTEEYTNFRINN